ncbi:shikimate kinase [Desulfoferrobacter suflitae]|uniref:shikimate kinase n=1 Tax=Desulfoferrobacter suflitae TaxID=2865782 RepID=UPI002164B964|nr:shikimate kinase [Desulfoferrobacter suflitae]MCK8603140.1 shikimate kinase [Desulfoferrobacter suflitae]
MEKSNIALIGFRATGKSSIGERLAQVLQRQFVDMDSELTKAFGQSIHNWVRGHGWESFRYAESELLKELAGCRQLVIATGGGVIGSEGNRTLLKKYFYVIWLKATPETIRSRLLDDRRTTHVNRPPLTDLPLEDEIDHLLRERLPLYEESADVSFATDNASVEEVTEQIVEGMGQCKDG